MGRGFCYDEEVIRKGGKGARNRVGLSIMREEHQKYRSWVEVDLDRYRQNCNEVRRLVGSHVKIMQVVKADAYGHGAIQISKTAITNGAACLGVANADEGMQLRISGIDARIVVLSPPTYSEIDDIIKYELIPSISDPAFARELQKRLERRGLHSPVHVEIDTGIGRGGIGRSESLKALREIADMPNLRLDGIYSHFACSESPDDDYNLRQWTLFHDSLEEIEKIGIRIPIRHMCNSGGLMNFPQCHLDMVRPGIMTYGVYPGEPVAGTCLLPVMSFKTSIVLIKDFPAGHSIGYNRTYITSGPTRVATIPVGYADGYGVILSNQGEALVRGKRAPIVGRVSMDMCTMDVTHIPDCAIGDEVVILGQQGEEAIVAVDIARRARTNSYEILCALGKRAPRVFLDRGEANGFEPRLRRIFIPDGGNKAKPPD
jgi:alanine racemase